MWIGYGAGGSGWQFWPVYRACVLDVRFRKEVGVSGNDYRLVETDSCAALTRRLLSVWANYRRVKRVFPAC